MMALGPTWDGADIFEPVVILKPENVHIGRGSRIDSFVKIEGGNGVWIGQMVHISSFSHINIGGGEVWIGDGVGVASGAKILGGSNQPEGLSMSASAPAHLQVVTRSKTVIERFAFIATNAVIMPGVTIGEGAVIGAGALVTQDVPAYEVWMLVPARPVGKRVMADAARWPKE